MITVLAIAGSLRRQSYNRMVLCAAAELAPAGMSIRVYDDLASVPPFDEDLEVTPEEPIESIRRLRGAVASADGLLIATPEYNWSIPGVLKNAIDWLSRPEPRELLAAKPVGIIGVSSGRWGTRLAQAALRQVLTATESLVMPSPALFVADAADRFDEGGRLVDNPTRIQLYAFLAALARWIDLATTGAQGGASTADPTRASEGVTHV